MLKDHEPNEPARIKAERRWKNHDVATAWKELQKEEAELAAKEAEKQPPKIASVIRNDKIVEGRVIRAQTQFAKDLRAMMEGHAKRNLYYYLVAARQRKLKRLLYEKLKRLEARAAQREQEKSNA